MNAPLHRLDSIPTTTAGAVTGAARTILRAEAAAVLIASLLAYAHLGASWGRFAALFLLPDLSMLGYLVGRRAGAAAYNAAHSYLGPAALALAAVSSPALWPLVLVWTAHVGFDRALGYGLKHPTAFGETHLGRLGRAASRGS